MCTSVRAVRLVKAGLENDAARDRLGEPRQMVGDSEIQGIVLDDTRTSDQKQRVPTEKPGHLVGRFHKRTRRARRPAGFLVDRRSDEARE